MRPIRSLPVIVLFLGFSFVGAQTHGQQQGKTVSKEAAKSDAEIRELYDRWAKAFGAHDLDGIMSVYASGDTVISYDIVAPLQYVGRDAYRKDYEEFLAQYTRWKE